MRIILAIIVLAGAHLPATELTSENWTDASKHWVFTYQEQAGKTRTLDLSFLNARDRNPTSFVRVSADGGFERGDGSAIRFWAVGTGVWDTVIRDKGGWYQAEPSTVADLDAHLAHLARIGVNMVRIHADLYDNSEGAPITAVDATVIDRIQRFCARAAPHGIFVTVSPFWAHGTKVPASWNLAGYTGDDVALWGLVFGNDRLRDACKNWIKELLIRPNPHRADRKPLLQDPTLAVLQCHNEDSLYFWTSQGIKAQQQGAFLTKWKNWLIARHGSVAAAYAAWGGLRQGAADGWPADTDAQPTLHIVWHLTRDPTTLGANLAARLADQTRFFAETMRGFYQELTELCTKPVAEGGLGSQLLVNGSNWKTASDLLLNDQERWSYGGAPVDAVNHYVNAHHSGPTTGWMIQNGDHYLNRSALFRPLDLPTNRKLTVGRPMLLTEVLWVPPMLYQSEGPFLGAAYQSLTGVDALYWFSCGSIRYCTPRFPWQLGLTMWNADNPAIMGSFPAAALLFRQGLLRQADPVVHEERRLSDLWERRTPVIAEGSGYDPNRDDGFPSPGSGVAGGTDPLAYLVGPVEVVHGGNPAKSTVSSQLSSRINKADKTVTAATGEIVLDHGKGVCRISSPQAQGVCGFLKDAGGSFDCGTLKVISTDHYATVLAVALDGKALASSGRILLQVVTTCRPRGFQATWDGASNPQALTITSVGDSAANSFVNNVWAMARSSCTLELANTGLSNANAIDPAGHATDNIALEVRPGGVRLSFPPTALWVIVEGATASRRIGVRSSTDVDSWGISAEPAGPGALPPGTVVGSETVFQPLDPVRNHALAPIPVPDGVN